MVAVISTAHGLVSDQVPLVGGLAFFVTNKSHKLFQRLGEGSIAPPNIEHLERSWGNIEPSWFHTFRHLFEGCDIYYILYMIYIYDLYMNYIWFIYDLYMIYICILYIYNTLIYI